MSSPSATLIDVLSSSHPQKSLFSSPEITSYVSDISNLSLTELLQEPVALSSESAQLTNSLTTLCHSEYSTFLSLRNTSSLLNTTFEAFESSLQSLLDALPPLEAQASRFMDDTKAIQADRKKATLVLDHHDKLLDVLEIPQLIDTCVRNGYYQEAMDLAAHTTSLALRFPDIPIILDVAAEVEHATRLMLAQLLSVLREPVKLPQLFKAVNFLRRTAALSDLDLSLAFLTSRLAVLEPTLAALDSSTDHARYLRRYVDVWREGVHDLVTQYTTIFLERSPSPDVAAVQHRLLATCTYRLIDNLLDVLTRTLPLVARGDPSSLSTLLTQLTYCATSFARLGLDFRTLLPPPFEAAVLDATTHSFKQAALAFVGSIPHSTWTGIPDDAELELNTSAAPHVVPHILASSTSIAQYSNALLISLNNLRLLAPAALMVPLLATLDASLATAAIPLLAHATAKGAETMKRPGRLFARVFVPFVRRALVEGVYSATIEHTAIAGELADVMKGWDVWLGLGNADEGVSTNGVE